MDVIRSATVNNDAVDAAVNNDAVDDAVDAAVDDVENVEDEYDFDTVLGACALGDPDAVECALRKVTNTGKVVYYCLTDAVHCCRDPKTFNDLKLLLTMYRDELAQELDKGDTTFTYMVVDIVKYVSIADSKWFSELFPECQLCREVYQRWDGLHSYTGDGFDDKLMKALIFGDPDAVWMLDYFDQTSLQAIFDRPPEGQEQCLYYESCGCYDTEFRCLDSDDLRSAIRGGWGKKWLSDAATHRLYDPATKKSSWVPPAGVSARYSAIIDRLARANGITIIDDD